MSLRTRSEPASMPGEPPRRFGSRLLLVGLAVLVLAVVVLVAVNLASDTGPEVTATSTPPGSIEPAAPTTLDPQAEARAAVLDAYVNSYQLAIAVGKEESPDLDDPRLTQYSTGTALLAKQRALADNMGKGLVYFGDAELHPTVVELGRDRAVVVDCSIDTTGLVHAKTGEVAQDGGNGEGLAITAELIVVDGVWKVNHFTNEKRSCVPPVA